MEQLMMAEEGIFFLYWLKVKCRTSGPVRFCCIIPGKLKNIRLTKQALSTLSIVTHIRNETVMGPVINHSVSIDAS